MIVANARDVGAVLKSARQAKGMTQQDLASMLHVTRQWVASVETGAPTARLGLVLDALKCVDLWLETKPDDSQEIIDKVFGSLS